jgi:hypothetical protein
MKLRKLTLIVLFILITSFSLAETKNYYEINLLDDNKNITISSINVIPSGKNIETIGSGHSADLISSDGEVIETVYFSISSMIYVDEIDPETGTILGGGVITNDISSIKIYLPYHEDSSKVIIYDENQTEILSMDVAQYSKIPVTKESTTQDQEPLIEYQELEPKQVQETSEIITNRKKQNQKQVILGIALGVGIFFLLLIILLIVRKKKPNPPPSSTS